MGLGGTSDEPQRKDGAATSRNAMRMAHSHGCAPRMPMSAKWPRMLCRQAESQLASACSYSLSGCWLAGWLVHHARVPQVCCAPPPRAQEARTNEVAPGNDDFQAAIKRGVPLGWVFKGFPFHTTQPAPGAIWRALADEPQVRACVRACVLSLQESTACS